MVCFPFLKLCTILIINWATDENHSGEVISRYRAEIVVEHDVQWVASRIWMLSVMRRCCGLDAYAICVLTLLVDFVWISIAAVDFLLWMSLLAVESRWLLQEWLCSFCQVSFIPFWSYGRPAGSSTYLNPWWRFRFASTASWSCAFHLRLPKVLFVFFPYRRISFQRLMDVVG